ncbi:hypothetical protein L1887_05277 [Cichorium endivia]|nr:hypothetical protein L1887_05277 [Cichorium endivia]
MTIQQLKNVYRRFSHDCANIDEKNENLKDKAQLLDIVTKSAKHVVGVNAVIHMNASKNDDESTQIDSILHGIDDVLGYITKEVPKGKLLEKLIEKIMP